MALIKEMVIDKIEILATGHVQVRRAVYIVEDGIRIAGPNYYRSAYAPGENVTHEDTRVRAHCAVAWTPEVIASYRASQTDRT